MMDEDGTQGLYDARGFQTFGRVLDFDWHSSGLTTTTCGALDEGRASSLPIPLTTLAYASQIPAWVDNTAIQDGYPLHHHLTVLNRGGHWAVIPQDTNDGDMVRDAATWAKIDNRDCMQAWKQLALFQEGPQTNGAQ